HDVAEVLLEDHLVHRIVAGVQAGRGQAGARYRDSTDLPAAKSLVERSGPIRAPAFASSERQFVERAVDPIVFGVEHRWAVVQLQIIDVRGGLSESPVTRRR